MSEPCEWEGCNEPATTMTIRGYECELIYCKKHVEESDEAVTDLIVDVDLDKDEDPPSLKEQLLQPIEMQEVNLECGKVAQAFQFILQHSTEHSACPQVFQVFQTIIDNAPQELKQ